MKDQYVKLSQLFRNNNILVDLNIEKLFVKKVKIYTHSKTISIILISKKLMLEQDLGKIKRVLEERFQNFNILLKIKYDIPTNIENIMDQYWDNLSYYIEKEIPSSSSWIKDLD